MDQKKGNFLTLESKGNTKTEKSKLSVYQIIGLFVLSNVCVIGVLLLIYLLF